MKTEELQFHNGEAVTREKSPQGVTYTYYSEEGEGEGEEHDPTQPITTLFIPASCSWSGEDAVAQAMAQRPTIPWLAGWLALYLFAPVNEVKFAPATRPLLGQRGFMFDQEGRPDERWFIIDAAGSVLWSPAPENMQMGFKGVVGSFLWEALGEFQADGWTWLSDMTPAFLVKVVGPQDGTNKLEIYAIVHPPEGTMSAIDWWEVWEHEPLAETVEPGIGEGLAEKYDLRAQIFFLEQEAFEAGR